MSSGETSKIPLFRRAFYNLVFSSSQFAISSSCCFFESLGHASGQIVSVVVCCPALMLVLLQGSVGFDRFAIVRLEKTLPALLIILVCDLHREDLPNDATSELCSPVDINSGRQDGRGERPHTPGHQQKLRLEK